MNSPTDSRPQASTEHAQSVVEVMPWLRERLTFGAALTFEDFLNDPRLIASRMAVQRQLENLEAALLLTEKELGHLAVGFVRPACEDFLWLKFLQGLDREDGRELLMLLTESDGMRSVQALLDYEEVDAVVELGFPSDFLADVPDRVLAARTKLKELGTRLGWKGVAPSTEWIAEIVHERRLYDYLYSAASRAIHFSAGETFRRAWFNKEGNL